MAIRFTYTLDQHAALFEERLSKISEPYEFLDERDGQARRRNKLREDFAAHRAVLRHAFVRLKRLGGGNTDGRLTPALTELAAGGTGAADALLAEIETRGAVEANRVDAVRMRARIAEAEARWTDATRHAATAARLSPTEANLKEAIRLAVMVRDARTFDHFAALRLARARAGHPAEGPELDTVLLEVHGGALRVGSELAAALWEDVHGKRFRAQGGEHPLSSPKAMVAALMAHMGADPSVDVLRAPQWRYEEARRRVLRLRGRPESRLDYATALYDIARALMVWGLRRHVGLVASRAAHAIRAADLGETHPDTLLALERVAWLTWAVGRKQEAEAIARRALALRIRAHGKLHPSRAEGLAFLAGQIREQRRYDEAARIYRSAIGLLHRLAPLDEDARVLLQRIRASLADMHQNRKRPPLLMNCVKGRPRIRELGPGGSQGQSGGSRSVIDDQPRPARPSGEPGPVAELPPAGGPGAG